MAARLFIRDSGGIARQIKRLAFRDGSGTARMIKRLFERDASGVARLIFSGVQVLPLTITGIARAPQAASAGVMFTSDGTEWEQSNQSNGGAGTAQSMGLWDPAGDGGNYDIRATLISGTAPNWAGFGNTLNTWIQPTSGLYTASWGIQNSAGDGSTMSCVLQIDIAAHGTGQVIASGQITLNATDRASLT